MAIQRHPFIEVGPSARLANPISRPLQGVRNSDQGSQEDRKATSDCGRDPLQLFVSMLREGHGGTDETERSNYNLLDDLINNGKIAKSNIIWHNARISRIYGLKIGHDGNIEYDRTRSPDRLVKQYTTGAQPIDMLALKNAIIKSKQVAI